LNIKHKLMNMRERLEAIPVGEVEEIPHNGKKWLRCHLINLANRNGMVVKTKVAGDNILVWRMR
jgi:hypothetical protein